MPFSYGDKALIKNV